MPAQLDVWVLRYASYRFSTDYRTLYGERQQILIDLEALENYGELVRDVVDLLDKLGEQFR